jgi:putative NADH-flavin reductase
VKVVVFGATGKTGQQIVEQALAHGHDVTAFVRDPSTATFGDESPSRETRLRLVGGDVLDPSAVQLAVQGQEVVICALGSKSLRATTVRRTGTANIVRAMEEAHVERLLVVSALGTGASWSSLSFINKLFYATLLRATRQDHEAQEAVVKASNVKWTIFRPSGLTDGAVTGNYALGADVAAVTSQIARADVAQAIVREIAEDAYVHMAVTITN